MADIFAMDARWWAERACHLNAEDDPVAAATIANAYATLAMVEQARISNLITLATGAHAFDGIARRASNAAHNALVSDPNGDLAPDIADVLGVSRG